MKSTHPDISPYFSPKELAGTHVVPFRVRRGDDASCLNLNRAQRPRLLGVRPELLKERFTVTGAGWELLKADLGRRDEIPAIGDAASILERLVRRALAGTALPLAINVAGPEPISVHRFEQ